jgi:hypothetical protein
VGWVDAGVTGLGLDVGPGDFAGRLDVGRVVEFVAGLTTGATANVRPSKWGSSGDDKPHSSAAVRARRA